MVVRERSKAGESRTKERERHEGIEDDGQRTQQGRRERDTGEREARRDRRWLSEDAAKRERARDSKS